MTTEGTPGFFARLILAVVAFWRLIFDREFAAGVVRVRHGELTPPSEPSGEEDNRAAQPEPAKLEQAPPEAAMQLLGILQRQGRLMDFLEEDIAGYSDADVGAAARVVHEGCRSALHEHFSIVPIRDEEEGAKVTIEQGFDASAVRLTGNVVGSAPFSGILQHRGWRVTEVKLPQLAEEHDVTVVAPAEVEL